MKSDINAKTPTRIFKMLFACFTICGTDVAVSAQELFTPNGTVGATTTPTKPFIGIGTATPLGQLEISLGCYNSSLNGIGGLVITEQSGICASPYQKMDLMNIRQLTPFGEIPLFAIKKGNGRVGIGTPSPEAQLEVKSVVSTVNPFQVTANDGSMVMMVDRYKNVGIGVYSNPGARFHIKQNGGTIPPLITEYDGGAYTYGMLYKYTGTSDWHKALAINNAAGKDIFIVHSNGYTVIGDPGSCNNAWPGYLSSASPYKLVVEKGIITEKVKVAVACTTDWSDYVFDDNYKLRSVEDVASFIKENKHLPDMPSAAEMVSSGNDLGQTDALLLKQVEELWLQVIDLKKQLKALENEKKK